MNEEIKEKLLIPEYLFNACQKYFSEEQRALLVEAWVKFAETGEKATMFEDDLFMNFAYYCGEKEIDWTKKGLYDDDYTPFDN